MRNKVIEDTIKYCTRAALRLHGSREAAGRYGAAFNRGVYNMGSRQV